MAAPDPNSLTPREREVISLLRLGLTNEEIAQRLGITLDGAKYHVSQILSKLGVASREAAAVAVVGESGERQHWWSAWPIWAKIGASAAAVVGSAGVLATLAIGWETNPDELGHDTPNIAQAEAGTNTSSPISRALTGTPTLTPPPSSASPSPVPVEGPAATDPRSAVEPTLLSRSTCQLLCRHLIVRAPTIRAKCPGAA